MGLEILVTIWGMWYWEHFYSQLRDVRHKSVAISLLLLFTICYFTPEVGAKRCCPSCIVLCLVWYLMGFIIIDPPKKKENYSVLKSSFGGWVGGVFFPALNGAGFLNTGLKV